MASKKRARAQRKNAALEPRLARKRLRELGLISKRTDLRRKPTKAQLKTIEKYKAVLTGKAAVVELPRGKAKEHKQRGFIVKGSKVVVPKEKGERIRVTAEGDVVGYRRVGRKNVKRIIGGVGTGRGPKIKKGFRRWYTVRFGDGQATSFDSKEAMQDFLNTYGNLKSMKWHHIEYEDVKDDE